MTKLQLTPKQRAFLRKADKIGGTECLDGMQRRTASVLEARNFIEWRSVGSMGGCYKPTDAGREALKAISEKPPAPLRMLADGSIVPND